MKLFTPRAPGRALANALSGLALAAMLLAPASLVAKPVPIAADWANKVVPMSIFGEFEQVSRPIISPDGKWVAAKVRIDKRQGLVLLPIGRPDAKLQVVGLTQETTSDKQGDRQITDWQWMNEDTLLVEFTSRDYSGLEWFDNVRYAAYNVPAAKITPLGWDHAFAGTNLLWTSKAGRPHILLERINLEYGTELSRNPEVIDIDVSTGNTHVAVRPNPIVSNWQADLEGVVRFGSSRDRDTGNVRVLYRTDAKADFKTLVTAQQTGLTLDLQIPSLILRGNKAYSISRRNGFSALYEYDLATMKMGKQVFAVDGYDIDSIDISTDRARIDGVTYTTDRRRETFFTPRMKEILALLEETYGNGNVVIESTDAKAEKIVFTTAQPGQVPTIYLFDTVSGGIGRLSWGKDALKNAILNPVSTVHYQTSDGKTIEAVLTMPRHRAGGKNLPLIVMSHGGPWARDSVDWDAYQWAQAMAEIGYVVIQPNYRGSTGYGKAWMDAANKNWGYRMQDDLIDGIDYLAKQGIADAKRVCIMGWSYGGYAASRAAQRDGAHYRCAISGAGPSDLLAMVRYDKGYLGSQLAKAALGSAGSDLSDVSPALHADQYSIPILIVHGTKDQRVPVAQSRNLVQRLKAAGKVDGKDFVYIEQPNNTHNLLREDDRIQFLEETRKFLEKHNPA